MLCKKYSDTHFIFYQYDYWHILHTCKSVISFTETFKAIPHTTALLQIGMLLFVLASFNSFYQVYFLCEHNVY